MPTDLKLSREELFTTALRFRPGTSAGDVRWLNEGQLSMALLVGDVVLRFPRSAFALKRLKVEVQLLERIRPTTNATIPDVIGADLDEPLGKAFVAHRALPGSVLTSERLIAFDPTTVAEIGDSVAAFLRDLHTHGQAVDDLVPTLSISEFAFQLQAEVDRLLADRMTPRQRERAQFELAEVADLPSNPPVLVHSDLGGNVLFDEATSQTAFIDFGSALIGDPILDIASVSVLGEGLLERCASAYPRLDRPTDEIAVVTATFPIQDALYGARQADWSYVDEVLRAYAE
jgi:aminoglycoside phosphotransferase (APT) family kinase protein